MVWKQLLLTGYSIVMMLVSLSILTQTKLEWVGCGQLQEQTYARHEQLIAELAGFYANHGIWMMVLKGWRLSLNYPIPCHRACSDLDIYLFGEQERADRLLTNELGIKVDNTHHHHSVFVYKGLSVENHYDFLNVHAHLSSRKIEKRPYGAYCYLRCVSKPRGVRSIAKRTIS